MSTPEPALRDSQRIQTMDCLRTYAFDLEAVVIYKNEQISEKDAEIVRLKDELNKNVLNFQRMRSNRGRLVFQNEYITRENAAFQAQIQASVIRDANLQAQIQASAIQDANLQAQIQASAVQDAKLQAQIQSNMKKMAEMQTEIETLTSEIRIVDNTNRIRKNTAGLLQARIHYLEDLLAAKPDVDVSTKCTQTKMARQRDQEAQASDIIIEEECMHETQPPVLEEKEPEHPKPVKAKSNKNSKPVHPEPEQQVEVQTAAAPIVVFPKSNRGVKIARSILDNLISDAVSQAQSQLQSAQIVMIAKQRAYKLVSQMVARAASTALDRLEEEHVLKSAAKKSEPKKKNATVCAPRPVFSEDPEKNFKAFFFIINTISENKLGDLSGQIVPGTIKGIGYPTALNRRMRESLGGLVKIQPMEGSPGFYIALCRCNKEGTLFASTPGMSLHTISAHMDNRFFVNTYITFYQELLFESVRRNLGSKIFKDRVAQTMDHIKEVCAMMGEPSVVVEGPCFDKQGPADSFGIPFVRVVMRGDTISPWASLFHISEQAASGKLHSLIRDKKIGMTVSGPVSRKAAKKGRAGALSMADALLSELDGYDA